MVAAILISLSASARREANIFPEDAHIEIAQLGDDQWRVAYNLSKSVKYLDLGPSLNGFRKTDWRVEGAGVEIVTREGRDFLEATGKTDRFNTVSIKINSRPLGLLKHYEPIRKLGEGGALVYTGHFWPWRTNGGRINAAFFFNPMPEARISVFDLQKRRVERWQSIFNHPAFVYFGPLSAKETKAVVAIADPAAPKWITKEFHSIAPLVFNYLGEAFRFDLITKPNVFLSYEKGGPYGLLRYSGDALPGQFQISLYGGGWLTRSEVGVDLIRRATAHEAVHLWQSAINPLDADVPGWIHEGAADAIATEALVALGVWTQEDADYEFKRAKKECADELDDGSLAGAEQRGSVRGIYACGHILMRVAAEAHNGAASATAFWRAFARKAERRGGYDADMFFALVEEVGGLELANAMRRFERTPFARPDREINALLDIAAGAS